MPRVTDFRVDTVEMRADDYWKLPDQTRELIRIYGRELRPQKLGMFVFELPIYRWEEIKASMRALPSSSATQEKD